MLDIRFIRDNAERVAEASRQKGYEVDVPHVLELDARRRELQTKADELRAGRNEISNHMKDGKPEPAMIEQGKRIKTELAEVEDYLRVTTEEFVSLLKKIPNIPEADVPVGPSEDENVVASEWGDKPQFDFEPKNHWQLAEAKGWIDKDRAAKVAGSRFAYIKGDLVKMQFAIIQFVTDVLTDPAILRQIAEGAQLQVSDKPFVPVLPPLMIKTDLYDAMDRLEPRDDRYKIEDEDLWLQGSAEHVIGSMHADEICAESELPLRYLGYATSFRREAGTYGKDMEGIIRMHQFDKLEMESFATKETARDEHLFFVAIQEYLLRQLQIPYQKMMKCTGDIGKPNARGVDMNAWLPGQNKYRETHTADYMTDYQARRLQTRVRRENGDLELVHTNDATAFALGRTMVAIIENYQTADGNITIPEALKPYMGKRA
ncbi:MAG TPA: serine--tRNA ligase [Candidatus Saccharimonadales bacterium]|jgi:seryl-tRNA synthetase|nr:serine--tRNA ligase [Candidatus Saccharimonadales bacterium]